jgi:glycosyltransferase involved in cell wall biosynthesis
VVVHQLLSGAGPVDAVTGQARAYRRAFERWGWGGCDYAALIDPRVGRWVKPLAKLHAQPDDVLLLHYSAYAPRLRPLLELPNHKLLVSHNVTPARYLWSYEPVVAVYCAVGREQLPDFARSVDVAAGVSEYNVAELTAAGAKATAVVPILFDPPPAGAPQLNGNTGGRPPAILFVGRITPHKRHDLLLRAFALYRRHRAPDARLHLVGEPVSPAYGAAVRGLADELAPGAVTIEGGIAPVALWDRYRHADAFLSMSEHEGFCIPLLEAFAFAVPVIARPAGGIPEVAGDAALLYDGDDLAVVAELLELAVSDLELRAELARRAERRLAAYAPERALDSLRAAVLAAASTKRAAR